MDFLEGIAAVPIIAALVYGAMALYKNIFSGKEKAINLIPSLAAVLGGILGVAMFYTAPSLIPASDFFTALLIGGVSGLSATGINQTAKQIKKFVKPSASAQTDETAPEKQEQTQGQQEENNKQQQNQEQEQQKTKGDNQEQNNNNSNKFNN